LNPLLGFWNRPRTRALVYQTVLVVALVALVLSTAQTVLDNVHRAGIKTGFGFLGEEAGFAINQSLIPYGHESSYGRAIMVCFLNTLLLAAMTIVSCTVLGLVLALFRMSSNWLLSKLAEGYVELFRNVPLLLQLFFWYNAALRALPGKRESINFFGVAYLNIEGLFVPVPVYHPGTVAVLVSLALAFILAIGVHIWAARRQVRTGQPFPSLWVGLGLVVGVPFLVAAALGFPITWDVPHFERFNFVGGSEVQPELVAMLLGLTLYNTAFVGEIIRAGIQSVNKGQREAARSIGMRETAIYTKIVIPQARRLIIPPLTNQYLNLTKATALAAALGYPELFWALGGAIQSQTGQVLEIQVLTLGTYLVITAAIAGMMAWYNHRIQLVER
jgi:general L-amino acid transport system permease protein